MFCERLKCSLNTLSLKSTLACFWIEPSRQTQVFYFWFGVSAEQVPWSQITRCTPGRLWIGLWTKTYNYQWIGNKTTHRWRRFHPFHMFLILSLFYWWHLLENKAKKQKQNKANLVQSDGSKFDHYVYQSAGPRWLNVVVIRRDCLPVDVRVTPAKNSKYEHM